jgi:cytochrome P450
MGTGPYGGPERFFRTPVTAPGPQGRDMVRAIGVIRRDPLAFLVQTRARYGPVVQFPVPQPPSYLVSDPGAVDRVLRANARGYGKRTVQYSSLSLVTGEGLLTADTEPWRLRRRLVQPAFHHRAVAAVADHVAVATDRLDRRWSALAPGEIVDLDADMMHAALEVVGRSLFGSDLSGDAAALAQATLVALEAVVARARNPLAPPRRLPTPGNRRLDASLRTLDGAVARMLAERRARPVGVAREPDMLDLLLGARSGAAGGLSDAAVRDEIVTFVVAGHETVASALTWSWHLLSHDPRWQDALAAEAAGALGDRPPAASDLASVPVARAVLDEALRLYPPAWLITRSAVAEDELAGHRVPAGALVVMSPWLVHRDDEVWPDPERFDPGRFLGGRREEAVRRAYLPFGLGPRLCIGRDMALLEGALVLAAVARSWEVRAAPGAKVLAEPVVTVRPRGGLPVVLRRR